MWFNDGHGLRRRSSGSAAVGSTTVKLLQGLLDMPLRVIFLPVDSPELAVFEISGRLERVEPSEDESRGVTLELNGRIPQLEEPVVFGVEVTGPSFLLRFRAEAAEEPVAGESTLTLSLPEEVEQVQRRHFARVPFSGKIRYEQVTAGKRFGGGHAIGVDLSAGGIKMVAPEALGQGQELLLTFETPDGRSFDQVRSTVVRVQRQAGKWAIACRFDNLSGAQEATLVQVVFRIQLQNPTRG